MVLVSKTYLGIGPADAMVMNRLSIAVLRVSFILSENLNASADEVKRNINIYGRKNEENGAASSRLGSVCSN
jgi:hypothetical protein